MTEVAPVSQHSVKKARLDSLTGLRWWAAFGVFLFHMHVFAPVPVLDLFARFGNYGVAFFFILSGFVLTWSARPGASTRNFYWRRFARIYPAHLVALLIGLPIFYRFGEVDPAQWWIKSFSVIAIVPAILLVQAWSANPLILFGGSPVSWTLTVEAFFYALHPAANRFLVRFGRAGASWLICAVLLSLLAYPALMMIDAQGWWAYVPLPLMRVGEFFLGMSLATLMRLGWKPRVSVAIPAVMLCIYSVFYVGLSRFELAPRLTKVIGNFENVFVIVMLCLIILSVAGRDLSGAPSVFRGRTVVNLGTWSFAFYLTHSTVMYAFASVVGVQAKSWANLIWYPPVLLLSILAAWLLFRFVEKPCEARLRRWGDQHLQSKTTA